MKRWGPRGIVSRHLKTWKGLWGYLFSPTKQIPHQHHDGASFIRTLLLCPQLGCLEAKPLNWYVIDNPIVVVSTTWFLGKPCPLNWYFIDNPIVVSTTRLLRKPHLRPLNWYFIDTGPNRLVGKSWEFSHLHGTLWVTKANLICH